MLLGCTTPYRLWSSLHPKVLAHADVSRLLGGVTPAKRLLHTQVGVVDKCPGLQAARQHDSLQVLVELVVEGQ